MEEIKNETLTEEKIGLKAILDGLRETMIKDASVKEEYAEADKDTEAEKFESEDELVEAKDESYTAEDDFEDEDDFKEDEAIRRKEEFHEMLCDCVNDLNEAVEEFCDDMQKAIEELFDGIEEDIEKYEKRQTRKTRDENEDIA